MNGYMPFPSDDWQKLLSSLSVRVIIVWQVEEYTDFEGFRGAWSTLDTGVVENLLTSQRYNIVLADTDR